MSVSDPAGSEPQPGKIDEAVTRDARAFDALRADVDRWRDRYAAMALKADRLERERDEARRLCSEYRQTMWAIVEPNMMLATYCQKRPFPWETPLGSSPETPTDEKETKP